MALTIDVAGQTVVVVGGTSGINRGIAELFAAHGAKVAVASRKQEKVDDTVAKLKSLGAEAMGFTADVRKIDEIEAGLQQVHEAFGDFDVVVSGAAGNFPAMAAEMSANAFRSVIDIDLMGTYHVMRSIYPYLVKPGASVINISAPQSYLPMAAQSHVCAAKAGVDMITRCLSIEWGVEGIRVNSVVPGPIDTTEGMKRLAPTEEARAACIDSVPMKRMGLPVDIAQTCMFLASPLASYLTGAVIPVDGGWSQAGTGDMQTGLPKMLGAG